MQTVHAAGVRKKESLWRQIKKYKVLIVMTIPGILYFFINNYLPMFGVIIAFKNLDYKKGILGSDWIGFKNFEFLFRTEAAFIITRNTVVYNAIFILLNLILAVTVAILLNAIRRKLVSRFYQSVILLPYLLSAVIIGYLVFSFLSVEYGFVNKLILEPLGLDGIAWYSEPKYWPYILVIVNAWKSIGYFSIVYLAAIVGIDSEYYEAAVLDGANKWQQVRSITLPLIMPIIMIMVLLQIGKIFNADFGLFFQVPMNSGALMSTTDVIDTYVYRALLQMGDIGMASAAGLYQSVLGFVLVFVVNYIVKKINSDHALF
ncbi:sugar ABC transporter permease [Paenibacillus baekrokdamisoli]|uniref:Sugar ABC transporter permease n=1 Tax=Paenibacillus baekrokdamisoli TaxID=1712516 RepID=A0A3G9J6B1_9BACL|nr:ABC transporter permease subunit [Paenibacillus baekrokdamisoli]MBB3070296.1 putative aldouronate transport system permease protein [Paenibacillus baekrokdamisoli]BBH21301.1 sugar ABC transporter permease [Paenibacillus baekrokdamisoli]